MDYEKMGKKLAYVITHKQWIKWVSSNPEERLKYISAFGLPTPQPGAGGNQGPNAGQRGPSNTAQWAR